MARAPIDRNIMDAQAAYIARGMTGPSPDMDLALLPESVRGDLRSGFTRAMWTPSKDDLPSMSYEEMLARQSGSAGEATPKGK